VTLGHDIKNIENKLIYSCKLALVMKIGL